ncbi:MAG TPA: phBC6A51 family helix-turn-helix protein [Candidatus Magasanikbacteria bacterium]|nr:phBC6A51 family helix-turn-helix protein [Candidatus Magasanikbacteria bacterium]
MKPSSSIARRQAREKQALLEQLTRTPTIEVACQKVGIARATFYRWRKASKQFAQDVEEAQQRGREFITDVAESNLIALIGEKKFEAIRLWLTNHSPRFANKLELSGTVNHTDVPLTKEQKAIVRQALKLSSLNTYEAKPPKTR